MGNGRNEGRAVRTRQRPARHVDIETGCKNTPDLQRHDGELRVAMTSYGREVDETTRIAVQPFPVTPARIKVSGGVTKKIGEFEFARVDISLELPCLPHIDDMNNALNFAEGIVEERLAQATEGFGTEAVGGQTQPLANNDQYYNGPIQPIADQAQ